MVKIEDTAEAGEEYEDEVGLDPEHYTSTSSPPLSPLPSSSFNFSHTHYDPHKKSPLPPQPIRLLSPPGEALSSPSPISSDHTFHRFSPQCESEPHLSPSPANLGHSPSPSPAHSPSPPHSAVVNRLIREDPPPVVTKTESHPVTGHTSERDASAPAPAGGIGRVQGGVGKGRGRVSTSSSIFDGVKGERVVRWAAFGLRVFEFSACLLAFSVMAADKNRGWALDSFDRYKELRYCISVNVIGFAYSGLQGFTVLHQLVTKGKTNRSPIWPYFDFLADQILAYLLVSASSSAATRVDDWISNWGKDKFPTMASASVGMSFIAFVAFGVSSLISGSILCRVHRGT